MFYAHTVSPVCIAVLVSLAVMVVTGLAASWYLSLIAAAAYLCIGVLLPRFFSRRMAETGMRYRRELGDFGAYFLDSIKGIRELVLYNAGEARAAEVDRRSDAMLGRTKTLKRETALPPPLRRPPCRYRCWQCWLWGSSSFTAAASAWGAWCWA